MNSITDVMSASSTVSNGPISSRTVRHKLFVAGYLAAITVATIGWVSAFGWIGLRIANWLLA